MRTHDLGRSSWASARGANAGKGQLLAEPLADCSLSTIPEASLTLQAVTFPCLASSEPLVSGDFQMAFFNHQSQISWAVPFSANVPICHGSALRMCRNDF